MMANLKLMSVLVLASMNYVSAHEKSCTPSDEMDMGDYLDSITSEGACWELEEVPYEQKQEVNEYGMSIVSEDSFSMQADDDTCNYQSDYVRGACNAMYHPTVKWVAGGSLVAVGTSLALEQVTNNLANTMENVQRMRVAWQGPQTARTLGRGVGTTLKNFSKEKLLSFDNSFVKDISMKAHYEHNLEDDVITRKNVDLSFALKPNQTAKAATRDNNHVERPTQDKRDALDGHSILDITVGAADWYGGVGYGCLYDEIYGFLWDIYHGNQQAFGCGFFSWSADDGVTKVPIHWTMWYFGNRESKGYHHMWGTCCLIHDAPNEFNDINF